MWAKRFWTTAAHLVLGLIIVTQLLFVTWTMVKIVPAYLKSYDDRLIGFDIPRQASEVVAAAQRWLTISIRTANHAADYWWLLAIGSAVALGLFEWRVRSENKSLMRLSAMGVAAFGLTVFVGLTATALVIPYVVAVPRLYVQHPEPVVDDHLTQVDRAIEDLERALSREDWVAGHEHALAARDAVRHLEGMGSAAPALVSRGQQAKIAEVRDKLRQASRFLSDAEGAMKNMSQARAEEAVRNFRDAYGPIARAGDAAGSGAEPAPAR